MDDDTMFSDSGTTIEFEYGDMAARVSTGANLSPDFIHTIAHDLKCEVIAGARQLGMATDTAEASADD